MNRSPRKLYLLVILATCGCKGTTSTEPRPGAKVEPPAASTPVPMPSGPTGTVSGTVTWKGKPPAMPLIDTSMDPACGLGGAAPLHAEQVVVSPTGALANVFVYVKSGPAEAMRVTGAGRPPVVLDQKNCRYVPHVIAVAAGGAVEFRNSDPTMHNIHTMPTVVGNETIDVSQGPNGAPQIRTFAAPENLLPVRCNNHPWMNAFINVAPNVFFAVTGLDGRYTLPPLPAGQYTLGFVQEKAGEKTAQVAVTPNGTVKQDLAFTQ